MLRFLGVVAFLSYPQLDLQGFLHLPYHRFLFHTGLLSKGRSYPVENGELVGRFGEIFLTASGAVFPISRALRGFSLRCLWQLRLPSIFYQKSSV